MCELVRESAHTITGIEELYWPPSLCWKTRRKDLAQEASIFRTRDKEHNCRTPKTFGLGKGMALCKSRSPSAKDPGVWHSRAVATEKCTCSGRKGWSEVPDSQATRWCRPHQGRGQVFPTPLVLRPNTSLSWEHFDNTLGSVLCQFPRRPQPSPAHPILGCHNKTPQAMCKGVF